MKRFTFPTFLACVSLLFSCGDRNAFSSLEHPTPAEKAAAYLEQENPDAAIDTVLHTLGDTYQTLYAVTTKGTNNEEQLHAEMLMLIAADSIDGVPNLVSLLASAQAQKFSVDPFAMVLRLAKSQTSTALVDATFVSLGAFTQLYPILPKATASTIKGLQAAVFILQSLGSVYLSKADHLKLGLFLTASLVLELKLIDANEDGTISIEEALDLSEESATTFVTTLEAAVSSILLADLSTSKASAASAKITTLQTTLQNQAGTSNAEKLQNFFIQTQSKSAD